MNSPQTKEADERGGGEGGELPQGDGGALPAGLDEANLQICRPLLQRQLQEGHPGLHQHGLDQGQVQGRGGQIQDEGVGQEAGKEKYYRYHENNWNS